MDLLAQPNSRRYKGLRDACVLHLCYCTLRISEVLQLEYPDIDLAGRTIRIIGKGNKERTVPLPDMTANLLSRYIGKVVRKPKVFPVSYNIFMQHFHAYARAAGLEDEITPHYLRHSGATHMYQNGAPLAYLSKLLGHSSLAITEIYLSVNPEDLKQAMSFHPLNAGVIKQEAGISPSI